MFLVFLPFHVRMPLLLKEEKLKCLTSQLHMGRHQLGFPRIGRYPELLLIIRGLRRWQVSVIYYLIVHSQVSVKDAKKTVDLWYNDRKEVLQWQEERKKEAHELHCVHTLLGRARRFPLMAQANTYQKGHIERAAINTPVQVLNS